MNNKQQAPNRKKGGFPLVKYQVMKQVFFIAFMLLFASCRVKQSEQKQSRLEINKQVQAVSIATKQIDRLVLRLDSTSLTIAQFDTLGRITSLTQAKQSTRTETKEQETAQDSVQTKGSSELVQKIQQQTKHETKGGLILPKALQWILGAVVLLLILALVWRIVKSLK